MGDRCLGQRMEGPVREHHAPLGCALDEAGIDQKLLDPRAMWADKDEYDRTAKKLVDLFVDNFARFADHVDQGVRDSAPKAA